MESFPLLNSDGTPLSPQPAPRVGETWIPRREEIHTFARLAVNLARKNHSNRAGYQSNVDVERVGIATPGVSSIGVLAASCSFRIEGRTDSRRVTSDHSNAEPAAFDIAMDRYLGRPVRGREPPIDWRDDYFNGRKPKAYQPPIAKQIVDDEVRTTVAMTKAAKIRIAEHPDRRGQSAHGLLLTAREPSRISFLGPVGPR